MPSLRDLERRAEDSAHRRLLLDLLASLEAADAALDALEYDHEDRMIAAPEYRRVAKRLRDHVSGRLHGGDAA